MGVKYSREYNEIINDFSSGINKLINFYDFFNMSSEEWNELPLNDKNELIKTLADDLIYALGSEEEIAVGEGKIIYNKDYASIDLYLNEECFCRVSL